MAKIDNLDIYVGANSGGGTQGGGVFGLSSPISPTQIAANTDNYAPTGLSTANILRLSTDASRNLTGITGGVAGRILGIHNVGSFSLVLKNDTTSTAANRFLMDADCTLAAGQAAVLWYDTTSSRWRLLSRASSVAGGVVADGDYGDITVSSSGTAWAVDSGAISVAKLATGAKKGTILATIDGGGSVITTGIKGDIFIPIGITIVQATTLADQSGSIVIDIWKDSYANFPPTGADTITASAKPTLSSATKAQDATLTGWTTSVSAGDILRFNVDSITTCTRVLLALDYTKA